MASYPNSILLRAALVVCAGMVLQGCEMTEGFGRDVSSAGQAVTDSAQENKGY